MLLVLAAAVLAAPPKVGPYKTYPWKLHSPEHDASDRTIHIFAPAVPISQNYTQFPLLVYAHGYLGGGELDILGYSDLFHQIASYGFVVAAHASCSRGCTRPGGASRWTRCAGLPDVHGGQGEGWNSYYSETLKTIDFALVAPGLIVKYGRSKWMRLAMALEEGVEVTMDPEDGMRIAGPAGIIFQVENQTDSNKTVFEDAFALRLNVTLSANVTVVSNASGSFLAPQLTVVSFPAQLANSTVGPVFILTPVVDLVSFVVEKLGLPLLNSKIAQGLPLPSSPQVQLNNTQVAIRQEYLVVASDVQVKPT